MPIGTPASLAKQGLFACPLAARIERRGEGALHRGILSGWVVGSAIAYSVGRAHMHKTTNPLLAHQSQQEETEVAIDRQIILIAKQRHIGNTGTVDNGVAPLRGGAERSIVEKRANVLGILCIVLQHESLRQTYGTPAAHKDRNLITIPQKHLQHMMPQQSASTQKKDFHNRG